MQSAQPTLATVLKIRNYRLFVSTQVVATTGLWMQRVAQDWLVLSLSGSAAAVGVTTAAQFLPIVLFGLFGGVIADRYPKRRLLLITQSMACLLATTLAVLTLTHHVTVYSVYAVAFCLGLVTVVDGPTRQLFVGEMVGRPLLPRAISLNSAVFQFGGLAGPAVAGVLINVVGGGWAFALNAMAYAAVVITLRRIRTSELNSIPRTPRAKGQLREGLRYIAERRNLCWTIVLVAFSATFGLNLPIVLAGFARNEFATGAGGYGLFNTLVAAGSLLGSIAAARLGALRLRSIALGAAMFGWAEAMTAFAPDIVMFGAMLTLVGFTAVRFLVTANTTVQTTTDEWIRGRVMSVYILVSMGGPALGGPIIGLITQHYGARVGLAACGVVPLIAAGCVALVLARVRRLRLRVDPRGRRPADIVLLVPAGERRSRRSVAA